MQKKNYRKFYKRRSHPHSKWIKNIQNIEDAKLAINTGKLKSFSIYVLMSRFPTLKFDRTIYSKINDKYWLSIYVIENYSDMRANDKIFMRKILSSITREKNKSLFFQILGV
jgi:hypothetical protein